MIVNGYSRSVTASSAAYSPDARTKGCCQPLAEPLPAADAEQVAAIGRALADATRVQMLHMLRAANDPVCVCDFTAVFDLGQATISHHLAKLRDAGLVVCEKRGIWCFYSLRKALAPPAQRILDALTSFRPEST